MRDMQDLMLRAQHALTKYHRTQQRIAECNRGPEPGDVFMFRSPAQLGIEFVVVKRCVDDPEILFCVPSDMNPMTGTHDVAITESSDNGASTLRCGRGLWIHRSFIASYGSRSGFLELYYVRKASDRLAAMVSGDQRQARTADDDPDYEEWMQEVTRAVGSLEQEIEAAG